MDASKPLVIKSDDRTLGSASRDQGVIASDKWRLPAIGGGSDGLAGGAVCIALVVGGSQTYLAKPGLDAGELRRQHGGEQPAEQIRQLRLRTSANYR
jgi:hypothetical protein